MKANAQPIADMLVLEIAKGKKDSLTEVIRSGLFAPQAIPCNHAIYMQSTRSAVKHSEWAPVRSVVATIEASLCWA